IRARQFALGNGLVRENTKRRGRADVAGIDRVPAIVPIVSHGRRDALRDPVQGESRAEEVVGRRNVAPRVPLLTHVCREPYRGVVESIADSLRLGGLYRAVAPLLRIPVAAHLKIRTLDIG